MALVRIAASVGAAVMLVGGALLIESPLSQAVPEPRSSAWSGPYDVRTDGRVVEEHFHMVDAGGTSVLIWLEAPWPTDYARNRLGAATIVDGRPGASVFTMERSSIDTLKAPSRGSASGVTVAWYGRYTDGPEKGYHYLASANFNGRAWSTPTIHWQEVKYWIADDGSISPTPIEGGSTKRGSLWGYAITQDAAGSATLAWRESFVDYSSGQGVETFDTFTQVHSGGSWGAPTQIQSFVRGVQDVGNNVRITSLADGRLLLCSEIVSQIGDSSTRSTDIACWTSAGAGQSWTSVPRFPASTQVWKPTLVGNGIPTIIETPPSLGMPAAATFSNGAWTQTPIGATPLTQLPGPLTGISFVLAEDGRGCGYGEVRAIYQHAARPERRAVDRRDHRLAGGPFGQAAKTAPFDAGPLAAQEALKVHARAEGAARAGQHGAAQVAFRLKPVHRRADAFGLGLVHRILGAYRPRCQ